MCTTIVLAWQRWNLLSWYFDFQFRIINWAPGVIFGLLALVAGLLTLLLPETYHRPLPTSVEEIAGWSRTDDKRWTKSRASDAEKHITVSTIIPDTFAQDEETTKEPLGETNMAYSGHTHDEETRKEPLGEINMAYSGHTHDELPNGCTGNGNGTVCAHASVVEENSRLWRRAAGWQHKESYTTIIVLYLRNSHPTWLVSSIFQISLGRSDNLFHNNVLFLKLKFGKSAFAVTAPSVWNEFPITLKSSETIATFRKILKTHLFKIAFPP